MEDGYASGTPWVLHHIPGTDWIPRPYDEFRGLQDDAILAPRWVIDWNYSKLLPQRLARATGSVLLDVFC